MVASLVTNFPSLSPLAWAAQSPTSNAPDGSSTLSLPGRWHHLAAPQEIDDESKHICLDSHLPNQFYFYRPSTGLLTYWCFAGGMEEGLSYSQEMLSGWEQDWAGGGDQWNLMAFTIFNAEGCHHWISILNNVAFHHKFFTTYLLNGKSYGSLSGW